MVEYLPMPNLPNRELPDPFFDFCHYCHVRIGERDNSQGYPMRTKDHVVARANGGVDLKLNFVWACSPCNHAKADDPSSQWCTCNFCRRARRKHWELYGVREIEG